MLSRFIVPIGAPSVTNAPLGSWGHAAPQTSEFWIKPGEDQRRADRTEFGIGFDPNASSPNESPTHAPHETPFNCPHP